MAPAINQVRLVNMIKNIIAIYPGRFQPFGQHHASAFKWFQKEFGSANAYIVTSNVVQPPKSPFSFKDKQDIIRQYGFEDRLVQVKNPYKSEEILKQLNPKDTAVVFMVGAKDMAEDPRFKIGKKVSGGDSYFQDYKKNKSNLKGFDVHGYLVVAPHVQINIPGYGEMSGTTLRKVLGAKKPRSQKIEQFKAIFGWYDKKTTDMVFNKLEAMSESTLFSKQWWENSLDLNEDKKDPCWTGYHQVGMKKKGTKKVPNCVPEQIEKTSIIKEGGAGGHMAHPFNIDWVKTGKDLVTVFQQSVNYLKKGPASVKIDGVNASIRLITLDNKKVYVMDRGSNKPLDVKGITKAELTDRFGAGHGMITVGGKVLDIFNDSIPACTPALKKLGLWDNPNILFNIEYVAGSTNVLAYDKNFLAVHGLLEIEQVTPTKRATKEKLYDEAAMQNLLNNLAPVANENGYEVLGSIPTTLESDPNLQSELNKKYTVVYSAADKETKTLSQWLAKAKVPTSSIKTIDGKIISALSKEVLIKISDGIPLDEFIENPKNNQDAVDGYIIYLATMKLGDAVLDKLSSPLGPVSEHEGIVIRDKTIYSKHFKITGKFILGGLASTFRK